MVPETAMRLVVLVMVWKALVLYRFVVVAEVPVALMKEKFWRVVEPVTKTSPPRLAKAILGSK